MLIARHDRRELAIALLTDSPFPPKANICYLFKTGEVQNFPRSDIVSAAGKTLTRKTASSLCLIDKYECLFRLPLKPSGMHGRCVTTALRVQGHHVTTHRTTDARRPAPAARLGRNSPVGGAGPCDITCPTFSAAERRQSRFRPIAAVVSCT